MEVCFDVETTGLNPWHDEIIQISMIDENEKTLLNSYVKPVDHTSWPEAEAVNGISYDMVKNSPTIEQLKDKIQEIIDQANGLIGYNLDFDIKFLIGSDITISSDKPRHDVMLLFAPIYGEYSDYFDDYKWQKLKTCADYFGYRFKAHDSFEDVKATLFCYKKIKNL